MGDTTPVDLPRGAIRLAGVTKTYDRASRSVRLRHAVPVLRSAPRQPFDALRGIDLVVSPGESIGVIGPNGAGKSTLLKLIAGVVRPSQGSVAVSGRVGSMVELGLGFHPELTGWENIACSGVVLGLSRREVDRRAPSIAEVAGIGDAIDDPLRTYSAGMRARLGFAVAANVDADVLAVDEALAVGDAAFQMACLDRIGQLKASGTTIVFVSHQMSLVAAVCARVVLLSCGEIVDDGPAVPTIDRYLRRAPIGYQPARAPAVHLESCRLVKDRIRSWDAIEIEAEIRVDRDVGAVPIAVELERRVDEPNRSFGATRCELAEIGTAGRYRLRGRTSPFPGNAGSIDVVTSLVDPGRHDLVDRAVQTLHIEGDLRPGNIELAVTPQFSIAPTPEPSPLVSPTTVGVISAGALAARLVGVSKRFARPGPRSGARGLWPGPHGLRDGSTAALADLDLDLAAGTAVGLIGPNGAGKSTLLRVLAGVTKPEVGTVATAERVVPILDLGLGFHPDLTGARNLATSAGLLGIGRRKLADRLDEIVSFAGLADVMDVPVKYYSTGMRARLGFALTMHAEADLLLIDELLSVGDEAFRRRAIDAVGNFRQSGGTVVFVSHDLRLVEEMCDRAVCLDRGRLVDDGPSAEIVRRYGGRMSHRDRERSDIGVAARIRDLRVHDHHVELGEPLRFDGLLEVVTPSRHTRLDLLYRGAAGRARPQRPEGSEKNRTFLSATLEPGGGALDRPGWYRITGAVDRNPVAGAFDLVLSIVDQRGPEVLFEASRSVSVGGQDPVNLALEVAWDVERLDGSTVA
jgi:ABC-type polysaccharide/polyol phosphate transport system ATPase subunit